MSWKTKNIDLEMGQQESCAALLANTLFLVFLPSAVSFTKCLKVDGCRVSTDTGTINLWPLVAAGNPPRFSNIKDNSNYSNTYSWNPCEPWTEGPHTENNSCQDIAVCLSIEQGHKFGIGTADSADFQLDGPGYCYITYIGSIISQSVHVQINLVCSESEEGRVDKFIHTNAADANNNHVLIGVSKGMLPVTCMYQHASKDLHPKGCANYVCNVCVNTLADGVIDQCLKKLYGFFSVSFTYLFGGMLYLKFSRGASGKDILPNYLFWSNLLMLVQDGCIFSFDKIRGLCCTKEYQKI